MTKDFRPMKIKFGYFLLKYIMLGTITFPTFVLVDVFCPVEIARNDLGCTIYRYAAWSALYAHTISSIAAIYAFVVLDVLSGCEILRCRFPPIQDEIIKLKNKEGTNNKHTQVEIMAVIQEEEEFVDVPLAIIDDICVDEPSSR